MRTPLALGTSSQGTMFVGFCAELHPLVAMLESMVGLDGETRDALTRYIRPLTGAYYFVPLTESLRGVIDAALAGAAIGSAARAARGAVGCGLVGERHDRPGRLRC